MNITTNDILPLVSKTRKIYFNIFNTHCAAGYITLESTAKIQIYDTIGDDGHKVSRDLEIINYISSDNIAIISFNQETKYDRYLIEECEWAIEVDDSMWNNITINLTIRPIPILNNFNYLETLEFTNSK